MSFFFRRLVAFLVVGVASLFEYDMAQGAAIDVNQVFNYTSTTLGAASANWSALVWDSSPPDPGWPNGAGVTVGLDLNALPRTLTMDQDVTLKQMQFYKADATTLTGGTITWDSGEAGMQCELGRNRSLMTNYSAGRIFTINTTFILDSDLRVMNWGEDAGTRPTSYDSDTSGSGKLILRIVPWLASNTCTLNIGGTLANAHTGGTTLTMTAAIMTANVKKADAFGTGVVTLNGAGAVNLDLKFFYPVGVKESPWKAIGPVVSMDADRPLAGKHTPRITLGGGARGGMCKAS